ncbi:hypothetical protein BV898_13771 [Hypsibius exemplaris]|uniref:EF-hand domain-containing protein n=1 Tax=Hypsibius exemplaris TaxID=2072580 RepID=A0A1W0W9V4_HYPEX|nr:hypothetical protein BV898_13771 [Hypsibius exemplaris]
MSGAVRNRTTGTASNESHGLMADYSRYKSLWFYKNVLDADGDGYTNEDDFIRLALKHAVFFCKGGYFKDIYDTYVHSFQKIWAALAQEADTNQDGVITFHEWYAYINSLRSQVRSYEDLPEHLRELIEHHFNDYDSNRDGQVDINEYRLYLCGRNMDLKMATQCFESLLSAADKAKGTINKKRFCSLVYDFLFSTSPNSEGTFICGPLNGVKRSAIDVYAHMAGVS